MNSISSIALSGLNAAQTSLNASAHNVANLATEGFKRQETVQTAIMVLIMTIILAVFFLGVDAVFAAIVKGLLALAEG